MEEQGEILIDGWPEKWLTLKEIYDLKWRNATPPPRVIDNPNITKPWKVTPLVVARTSFK